MCEPEVILEWWYVLGLVGTAVLSLYILFVLTLTGKDN